MVGLKQWLGESVITIDNLCDRAPEGEVEVAGGVLKFDHDCNWKLFTENLNDTMHPMVVHKSVVDAANQYIAGRVLQVDKLHHTGGVTCTFQQRGSDRACCEF